MALHFYEGHCKECQFYTKAPIEVTDNCSNPKNKNRKGHVFGKDFCFLGRYKATGRTSLAAVKHWPVNCIAESTCPHCKKVVRIAEYKKTGLKLLKPKRVTTKKEC